MDDTLSSHQLKDTIVFFVNESVPNFHDRVSGKTVDDPLPMRLPYDNIFLQFQDGDGFWIISEALKNSEYAIYITPIDNGIEKKCNYSFIIEDNISTVSIGFSFDKKDIMRTAAIRDKLNLYDDVRKENLFHLLGIITSFLSIMSCKNIIEQTFNPNKKRKKPRSPKPLCSYRILQIEIKKQSKSGKPQNLWSNRVHLCRGHIKTYTADRPLFGKYVGNVWCPPHAKGNKKLGVIHKDYRI